MPITHIFFDVGGTLIYPDMDRLLAPLLSRTTPTAEQMAEADRAAKYSYDHKGDDSQAHFSADDAPVNSKGHWQIYFETLLAALGLSDDTALLRELIIRASDSSYWTKVDPIARETLNRLRRQYRLAIISNADGRIRQVLQRAGIDTYFEAITDSGLVGHEKPDPRIFRAALDDMKAPAAESLYIGDIYGIDYLGATGVGMKAVLMDPNGVYETWQVPRVAALEQLPGWLEHET